MTTGEAAPKISAMLPYFGAKRNIAGEIAVELGDHRVFWDLTCASLAVFFAMPPCVMETGVDLYGNAINLARVLKTESTAHELYSRLNRIVFHEGLYQEAAARVRSSDDDIASPVADVDRAEDLMVCSWFGRNGVIGTAGYNQNFCVRYTANGGHAAKRWASVVESIPAWHDRLKNVTFLNRDLFDVAARIADESNTVAFVDPPYLIKGAKYKHDFRLTIPDHPEPLARKYGDHGRLALALRRFTKTRVVVSYYAHPALAELYPGWNQRLIKVWKSLVNQGKRDQTGATEATEVLLVNGPLIGRSAESKQSSFLA